MIPPHLRRRDRITIELREIGPDDGRRVGAEAWTLVNGYHRPRRDPPSVEDYSLARCDDPGHSITSWEWDGSTTPDGAYRFHRRR